MSQTWLTLLLLVLVLGHCQCQFLADEWTKSNELNVFATVPQLATGATGVHRTQESHSNNVTLATESESESEDLDPLAPHAAAASMMPLSQRKLSRGKRFVAFPLGSSASVSQYTHIHILNTIEQNFQHSLSQNALHKTYLGRPLPDHRRHRQSPLVVSQFWSQLGCCLQLAQHHMGPEQCPWLEHKETQYRPGQNQTQAST